MPEQMLGREEFLDNVGCSLMQPLPVEVPWPAKLLKEGSNEAAALKAHGFILKHMIPILVKLGHEQALSENHALFAYCQAWQVNLRVFWVGISCTPSPSICFCSPYYSIEAYCSRLP